MPHKWDFTDDDEHTMNNLLFKEVIGKHDTQLSLIKYIKHMATAQNILGNDTKIITLIVNTHS